MSFDSRLRQSAVPHTSTTDNCTLLEFKRFVIVGIVNTAVDLGVLNALILLSGTGHSGFSYSVLKTISFTVALANSYYLNRTWRRASEAAIALASFLSSVTASPRKGLRGAFE